MIGGPILDRAGSRSDRRTTEHKIPNVLARSPRFCQKSDRAKFLDWFSRSLQLRPDRLRAPAEPEPRIRSAAADVYNDVKNDHTSAGTQLQGQLLEQLFGGVAHEL